MSVRAAIDARLAELSASDLEAEIAKALADAIDEDGTASAVKELRLLMADIEGRVQEADSLDELAKKRAARRSS